MMSNINKIECNKNVNLRGEEETTCSGNEIARVLREELELVLQFARAALSARNGCVATLGNEFTITGTLGGIATSSPDDADTKDGTCARRNNESLGSSSRAH